MTDKPTRSLNLRLGGGNKTEKTSKINVFVHIVELKTVVSFVHLHGTTWTGTTMCL